MIFEAKWPDAAILREGLQCLRRLIVFGVAPTALNGSMPPNCLTQVRLAQSHMLHSLQLIGPLVPGHHHRKNARKARGTFDRGALAGIAVSPMPPAVSPGR